MSLNGFNKVARDVDDEVSLNIEGITAEAVAYCIALSDKSGMPIGEVITSAVLQKAGRDLSEEEMARTLKQQNITNRFDIGLD
ncbi:MAG: hypothetical protein ABJH28_05190 [Paraglaciecola sp.]|uniref:hypothetical protein n=1 Tax=Paraglaciecola sp. TaxID=1920173 RepID=UPI003267188D